MSIFDQIAEAKSSVGIGSRLTDGRYEIQVSTVELVKGFKGESFKVHFSVLKSEKNHLTIEPSPIGDGYCQIWNLTKNPTHASQVRSFLEACDPELKTINNDFMKVSSLSEQGVKNNQKFSALIPILVGVQQPLANKILVARSYRTTLKTPMTDGTKEYIGISYEALKSKI